MVAGFMAGSRRQDGRTGSSAKIAVKTSVAVNISHDVLFFYILIAMPTDSLLTTPSLERDLHP
jgi:hypothetical protein